MMGVAGAGKTLVGAKLAEALGWPFLDADEFHPASNIAAMRRGVPLEPRDRKPWLDAMHHALLEIEAQGGNAVLACSALEAWLRRALAQDLPDVRFVYLKASRALIRARVEARPDHFMPASLVDSQFATLEEPSDALVVDASDSPDAIVAGIMHWLIQGGVRPPEGLW